MKFASGPRDAIGAVGEGTTPILLYERSTAIASAGAAAAQEIRRQHLAPSAAAWDMLSIALSIVAADCAVKRTTSPDGWTRELELVIAVSDPDRWTTHQQVLQSALQFLTTDVWTFELIAGGGQPDPPRRPERLDGDCVTLLSGGLDSLVGAIDLSTQSSQPIAVSHVVRGDREKQQHFARAIGAKSHLQLNHNARPPHGPKETSQRSRSLAFLAFGLLAATTTQSHSDGGVVPLYICENGFIAINPPLTASRLGALSTRTAHPHFLGEMQDLLDAIDMRVQLQNPYAGKTKGEMLTGCLDQELLTEHASSSTSCGRYQRYGYAHCGRCIPCQIRRAAFLSAGMNDATVYHYENLGLLHGADLEDVRSVSMAIQDVSDRGLDRWLGLALSSPHIRNRSALASMIKRGLGELGDLHARNGIA